MQTSRLGALSSTGDAAQPVVADGTPEADGVTASHGSRRQHRLTWLLALLPGIVVLVANLAVATLAGKPEIFPSVDAYRAVLNAVVLLRMFGMFLAVVLVWWELRARRADRALLAVAVLSGPITYAVFEAFRMLSFFTAPEAAYYLINPLTIAALGSQTATAGLVETLWRAIGKRRGRWPGRVLTWRLLAAIGGGLAILYVAVLHAGGTTGFYIFNAGYRWLFT